MNVPVVEVTMLGRFAVRVDGIEVPGHAWVRRNAAALVKVLALAPHRQLHREQVIDALWPGVPVVPMMVMGATDGLYLRSAGIPTYGIQGFFYDRNDIRFHGRDERLKVQSFYEGQTFLYELVKRLAGRPSA